MKIKSTFLESKVCSLYFFSGSLHWCEAFQLWPIPRLVEVMPKITSSNTINYITYWWKNIPFIPSLQNTKRSLLLFLFALLCNVQRNLPRRLLVLSFLSIVQPAGGFIWEQHYYLKIFLWKEFLRSIHW